MYLSPNKTLSDSSLKEKSLDNKTTILKMKTTHPSHIKHIKKKNNNISGLMKHFIPLQKEWDNSIYAYKQDTIKTLPSYDKTSFYLIKNYLNFYNLQAEKTAISKRARKRWLRTSLNKTLVGKPNFKHTNDKVIILINYYNRHIQFFKNKLDIFDTVESINTDKRMYVSFAKDTKDRVTKIKELISKHRNLVSKDLNLKTNVIYSNLNKIYLKNFKEKLFEKELNSLLYRQIIYIEKSKINKFFLLPLLNFIQSIYDKKVKIYFTNIKCIYNSASVISEGIITRLKKRTNKPLRVVRSSINTFRLPPVDRLALYNDMFIRKERFQKEILKDFLSVNDKNNTKDYLDSFLSNRLKNNTQNRYIIRNAHEFKNIVNCNNTYKNINKAMESLKNKFTSGIRFEFAGRLTRRFVAQRAISKLVRVGNVSNTDSSKKGLSTTLLRGYGKSNVQYKQSKSKRRIGSFGLKTWISASN